MEPAAPRAVMSELEAAATANLERAFNGRLVAQDPSDVSASALLERVRRAREKGGEGSGGRQNEEVMERAVTLWGEE